MKIRFPRTRRIVFLSWLAPVALVALVALAAVPSSAVVSEVVRLLDNGLDSAIVSAWLDKQPAFPETLTPDELIALQQAGASPDLVKKLIALSDRPAQAATVPGRPALVPRSAAATTSPTVDLALAIAYKPRSHEEDEDIPDEPDLHVYLDGELVAATPSQTGRRQGAPLEITTRIERGPHSIRLLRERHEQRGRKDDSPWRHEAYACPEAIDFVVGDGASWRLEVDWIEPRFALRKSRPLSWRLRSGGTPVAGESGIGSPTDEWPVVCEDFESGLDGAKEPSKRTRRTLERCRRWSDIWDGRDDLAPRIDQLDRYEENIENLMGATP